jgi:hypothetical protein
MIKTSNCFRKDSSRSRTAAESRISVERRLVREALSSECRAGHEMAEPFGYTDPLETTTK